MFSLQRRLPAVLSLSLLVTGILMSAVPGLAQSPSPASQTQEETIDLKVGDILEILPIHTIQNPQYTWILTQERTFIEANRTKTFRKRIIQPGTYTLLAEIIAGDQSARLSRSFTLRYAPRIADTTVPQTPSETGSTTLVTVLPQEDSSGRSILPDGATVLRLIPLQTNITPLALDTDSQTDSNGDGNPSTDVENDGTFFQTDSQPLFLWFASPLTDRRMSVTGIRPDGTPIVQEIHVLSDSFARTQGLIQSPVQITTSNVDNLTYTFNATFLNAPPNTPILHHWEFGDGQQSILPSPSHTYAEAGTFTVTVQVQNLVNGTEIGTAQLLVTAEGAVSTPSSAISEPPASEASVPTETNSTGIGIPMKTLILIGGILFGLLLLILLLIAIVKKFLGKGLDLSNQFASIEETLLSKDAKSGNAQQPPPFAIPQSTPVSSTPPTVEAMRQKEEEHASTNPLTEKSLKIDEGNAPSWLKSGLAGTPTTPVSSPPPVPKPPVPAQKPVSPPPSHTPFVPSKPASASTTSNATPPVTPPTPKPASTPPPWMQPKAPAAPQTPAAQSPTSPPKPQTPPTQSPVPSPKPVAPASVPSPTPTATNTSTPEIRDNEIMKERISQSTPALTPQEAPATPPWMQPKMPTLPMQPPIAQPSVNLPKPQTPQTQSPVPSPKPVTPAPVPMPHSASENIPAPAIRDNEITKPQNNPSPSAAADSAEASKTLLTPQEAPVTPPWMQPKMPTLPERPSTLQPSATPPQPETPPLQAIATVPKPEAPAPLPSPAPDPKPETPPVQPPVRNPTPPNPAQINISPAPTAEKTPAPEMQTNEQTRTRTIETSPSDDPPIAFIRAESIETPKKADDAQTGQV